ncbi:ABC transporter permease [Pasteurellaceae bacterium Macca]|nr:ABC transporter permease [Pasteurellaceae bacterium Macca]
MSLQTLLLWRRFISTLAYFSMQSVFYLYLQQKGLSNAQIAFSLSALFFCSQALAIFAGILGDRYGLAKIMLLGCLLDVIAYFVFLSAESYYLIILATMCFGVGSCLFSTNARACLLALAGDEYAAKTRLQGKFLRVTSFSSMTAPLLAIPFIHFEQIESLIWCCFLLEFTLFAFMARPFYQMESVNKLVKFRWGQIREIISGEFIRVHLWLFIPLSVAMSFFVIFPYLFDTKLHAPEQIPVALFINGLMTVALQAPFSKHINLNVSQLKWIGPLLAIGMIVPWFIALHYASLFSAYAYLVVFTVIEVYALTAMANLLVKFDNGTNRGFIFGSSRLLQSVLTFGVLNMMPYLFLV